MARWIFNNIRPNISAMVSTHGYFSINRGEKSSYYPSWFFEKSQIKDENGETMPMPEFLYEGETAEINVEYDGEYDGLKSEHDNEEYIKTNLEKFIDEKGIV